MTEIASKTKTKPVINKINSFFVITLIVPITAPRAKLPVSPIKTLAGGALYHKNPSPAPIIEEQKIAISPAFFTYISFK